MRSLPALAICFLSLISTWGVLQAQRPFKEYPAIEYSNFPVPGDSSQKTEWVRARLRYPDVYGYPNNLRVSMRDGSSFPGMWTMDYPRSDRHLLAGVKRLTRIDTRLAEQVVELDGSDDIFNWPVVYGVEVGHWRLPDNQAKQLRDFLLRGGFFMCDDFHGVIEWEAFAESMRKVFPDRAIVEIPNGDAIFHTIYDLDDRYQVPGIPALEEGHTYEHEGRIPHWRGIYDDHNRLMVAICFNQDLGDSWEHADNPEYPEKYSALGIRIAMNYLVYAMTH